MVILFANIKKRLPKLELLDSLFSGSFRRITFSRIAGASDFPCDIRAATGNDWVMYRVIHE